MYDNVSEYVDSTEEILRAANSGGQRGLTEQATCESIITRFISTLGWDEVDKQRPFKVQMGSQTKEVDYALFLGDEDEPQAFVEAKPEKRQLRGEHLEQLRSYMRQEWVEWGLLTNGRQYQLVRLTPQTDGAPNLQVLIDVGLEGISESYLPDIMSKGSMESGEANQLGDDLQSRMGVIDVLKDEPTLIGEAINSVDLDNEASEVGEMLIKTLNQRLVVEAKATHTSGRPQNTFFSKKRQALNGAEDTRVVWMSSRPNGIEFLRENSAWGFVKHPRRDPVMLALYVSSPVQEVKYVGEIEDVVPVREFSGIDDTLRQQNDGKYVITLSEVVELEDAIPFGEGEATVRGMTYTTLGKFKEATTIDDL
ncbi:RecB family restriction endonuclease, SeqA-likeprotein [Halanaeroarchaeum sp. HSR-CO]|uniref:type I restriction enzyme HsdR N-terminal domain-containing protein n=1 Tax=Halanaeroarchaeum sp. HSR-CO TaxID=2866382 RepID=UPI00217E68DE|nr:type I restriction enzyme HsdR N-terminal domain-containing protein [Halanaeroarchaeum sp. HSR-CO]UWG47425.1 RecB family restriction endonuclease, SeqA-likeprotein [Halanaeroarchaeum sp. HSR-CO]